MEKNFCVEVWGNPAGLNLLTEIFYTEREAIQHFKNIRKQLDSSKFIMTKDSIVDIANNENAIYLTDLREL